MSDLSDEVLELAERVINMGIEERIMQARKKQCDNSKFAFWDGKTCFDCGDNMPKERIEMGRVRCIYCQSIAERKGVE